MARLPRMAPSLYQCQQVVRYSTLDVLDVFGTEFREHFKKIELKSKMDPPM